MNTCDHRTPQKTGNEKSEAKQYYIKVIEKALLFSQKASASTTVLCAAVPRMVSLSMHRCRFLSEKIVETVVENVVGTVRC